MLISYRVILYTFLFILTVLLLSIWFKRRQRSYSAVLQQQIVDLADTTIQHLNRAKSATDPLIELQEASYAYASWDAVKKLTTPEDLPILVDMDISAVARAVKSQMASAVKKFQ